MNEPGIPAPHSMSTSAPLPSGALTFGQILDRVYRLMRTHLKLFFGVAGVPAVAVFLFMGAMMSFMVKFIIAAQTSGNPIQPPALPPYFPMLMLIGEPLLLRFEEALHWAEGTLHFT